MINLKIGIMSDLHLFKKTVHIERALSKLCGVDMILLLGDIADRGEEKQYNILLELIGNMFPGLPVYCVSGNHDNPARNDDNYRQFERKINREYPSIVDDCGALYKYYNENIDLIGLNPLYHQKQFFFPDKGRQLFFLEQRLKISSCRYHIVMCHPPLIGHNPQRTADMSPYIALQQDKRFQEILDQKRNVIVLSGHTHVFPAVEFDNIHHNLYINGGSICPTTGNGHPRDIPQGNISLLDISNEGIFINIEGIHTEKIFYRGFWPDSL